MRSKLLNLPVWLLAIGAGVFTGLFGASVRVAVLVLGFDLNGGVVSNAVSGFVTGIGPGLVGVPLIARRNRREAELTGLDPDELEQARRASVKGPVPADPRLVRAARDLCAQRLETARRHWFLIAVSLTVMLALAIGFAVTAFAWSPWFLVMTAMLLWLTGFVALSPRQARKRLARLEAALPRQNEPAAPRP
ncbi:hypothetical protein LWF15_20550 [Kineosporia rhizophila]|uniref:hypothetical protein n=1 Tax=Kineosporia rhizophila TaxID=84633 RepID=UPI001E384639|nr:hypothetical protein [Kineosporia rhizophila]MCE0537889.1 hypothetical protein [Kineosporia rhizophila]